MNTLRFMLNTKSNVGVIKLPNKFYWLIEKIEQSYIDLKKNICKK